jgi:hypothetical protein
MKNAIHFLTLILFFSLFLKILHAYKEHRTTYAAKLKQHFPKSNYGRISTK